MSSPLVSSSLGLPPVPSGLPRNQDKKNLTLTSRLYWSLTLPAIALLSLGGLAWWGFDQINRKVNTIYDDRVIPLQQLKRVSDGYGIAGVDSVQKAQAGLVSLPQARERLVTGRKNADQAWASYRQTFLTPEEQQLVTQTEAVFGTAQRAIDRAEDLLNRGDRAALQGIDGWLYGSIDPLTQRLDQLIDLQLRVAASERQAAQNLYDTFRGIFIVALLVAVALSSPVGYAFGRALTAALRRTIDQVAGAASEIAAATEENERVAQQQARASQETQGAMVHLQSLAQNIAGVVAQVADQARVSRQLVVAGTETLTTAIDRMDGVRTRADRTAEQSTWLGDRALKIGEIAALVDEFAGQTKMLALNASLEAVRAGDRGREFAVVASEIRALADRSRAASGEINALVGELQQAIGQTSTLARASSEASQGTAESLRDSAIALERIAAATHSTDASTQRIDSDAKQELAAIQAVLELIQGLQQATEEGVRGLGQTRAGMEQLNGVVVELQSMV